MQSCLDSGWIRLSKDLRCLFRSHMRVTGTGRLFVVEQEGRIRVVRNGDVEEIPFPRRFQPCSLLRRTGLAQRGLSSRLRQQAVFLCKLYGQSRGHGHQPFHHDCES